jgi:hypothetical protein
MDIILHNQKVITKNRNDIRRLDRQHDVWRAAVRVTNETDTLRVIEALCEDLVCPILLEVPDDPVVSSTGFIFSNVSIWAHFRANPDYTCPMTRGYVGGLIRCRVLRAHCQRLLAMRAESRAKLHDLKKVLVL